MPDILHSSAEPAADSAADPAADRDRRALHVLLAAPRGFCAGVERAIEIVERALDRAEGPVYVRHEIVHNRHVVESLKARGAVFVDSLKEVPDGALTVFSAHGVSRKVTDEAARRGLPRIDATCPLVHKVHAEARHHEAAGRHVLFIGHRGHPEVEGTLGQVGDGAMSVIETVADAEQIQVQDPKALAYLTQTTLSVDDTRAIIAVLERRFPAILGPSRADICYATSNRQDAVKAIAGRVDLVLVVGSSNSSNSNRLVEVALASGCPRARLIDSVDSLTPEMLDGVATLGVTAGASAPESLVTALLDRLRQEHRLTVETVTVAHEEVTFALPRELAV